ncbi:MAG TPA: DnaJ domain-containing protein [Geothrix sp.]|nr:DnaJ domain-containing protein [Geothrix sp.]
MNPFDVLEIPPDASPEDIKAAYHRLAKQWHPDRYTGAAKVEAEARFRDLAEAFSILKDPGKRLAVMQQLPRTPVAPSTPSGREKDAEAASERTAEDWATLAKEAFEGGRVDQAQALIQYAIRMDGKKPQYHALLATILEQSGGDLRSVVRALEAAVLLAPRDVDSHLRLATHFQTLGMVARAQRHLQTAREIAPNHPKLRQTAPRGGKGAPGAAGQKGKAQTTPAGQPGLVDQLKDLWGRLTGKG